jgi:hypothetical protein
MVLGGDTFRWERERSRKVRRSAGQVEAGMLVVVGRGSL